MPFVRPRFVFVVARTRPDLFLTMRRRFLDDRTVHVLLDRRQQDRRQKPSSAQMPDRRRLADRRRLTDYWEDTAHHPAVLIPLTAGRPGMRAIDIPASARASQRDKESPMEPVVVDEARVLAWIQETRHVLQRLLPGILHERDALEHELHDATRRCRDLQAQNDALRAEVTRATAACRQLEQARVDLADSVGQFLAEVTHVLEPMRDLTARLGRPGHRHDEGGRGR
jgi:hypothetical protein